MIPPQRNADFAAGMERVLDVYRRPYDANLSAVCMDETPRQLIGEMCTPARPRGTGAAGPRRLRVPAARDLQCVHGHRTTGRPALHRGTLVMDNLNTHRPGVLYKTFEPAEAKALRNCFEFVYTSRHGGWLKVAEVELNVMIRQCLNRRIDSIDTLRAEVGAWQAARDRIRAKVDWQFTTDDARVRLKRLYPTFDM